MSEVATPLLESELALPPEDTAAERTLSPELSDKEVEERFAQIITHIDHLFTPETEEALTQVEMAKRGGSKQLLLMSSWYGRQ